MIEKVAFAALVVFCVTFTVTYFVIRLDGALERRAARRRNHVRRVR